MERLNAVLSCVLIIAVLAVGAVIWRADQKARDADARLACIERVQATATVGLLAPTKVVDQQGRLDAMRTLGTQLDAC